MNQVLIKIYQSLDEYSADPLFSVTCNCRVELSKYLCPEAATTQVFVKGFMSVTCKMTG